MNQSTRTRVFSVVAMTALAVSSPVHAAPGAAPPPVELTAEQDHQRTMDLLHIASLRPGVNGMNPNAPDAANYDEAKAGLTSPLPDPLRMNDGTPVTTPEQWWKRRRPEIVELFDREILGRVPAHTPKVRWDLTGTTKGTDGGTAYVTKHLIGHVDNSSYPAVSVNIELSVTVPVNAHGAVPLMMELLFRFPPDFQFPKGFTPPVETGPSWQQQVLAKGWGYAEYVPVTVQDDNGAGLTRGIIGLMNRGQPRKPDDWGALRAWAWGASRAMDYFETDPAIDAHRVGVEGHSRFGKTALVIMAYDPRFAIGYISSSGEGGASLYRRNFGEMLENLASSGEYHWMAGNFLKYAGPLTVNDLPIDAHELIALAAARPVFIGAGSAANGDAWVDAKGMFMAAAAAGPVYRLLGKRDMGTTEFPPMETALINGDIAYRQHAGGHTPGPNWPTFIAFADRYFSRTER